MSGVPSQSFLADLASYSAIDYSLPHNTRSIVEVFTQKEIGTVPEGTPDDVKKAFDKARTAQLLWEASGIKSRSKIIGKFAELLQANNLQIIDLIQAENGKAFRYAQEEMLDCFMTSRYYSQRAEKILKPRKVPGSVPVLSRAKVTLPAQGVIGIIAPWNFPLILAVGDAIAALMAGNAVVLKPASSTPYSALFAAKLLYDAGIPREIFAVVPGPGSKVGQAIIEHADHIVFTGSTANGRIIAEQAAQRLVDISAELGGKNPLIVTKNAKIDIAAEGAIRAAFTGTGQVCVAIERMYIEDEIYDKFVAALVSKTQALQIGPSYDVTNEVGSLSTLEQLNTMQEHVDDAISKGAKILAGGKARPDLGPLFFEPTILENVTPDMTVYATETFGPLVSIYRVKDVDEAIARANDSEYGLNAAVWSGSLRESNMIAEQLHVGTVNINEGYAIAWTTKSGPMGGVKKSGIGRRHGLHGLTRFTDPRLTVSTSILTFEKIPFLSKKNTIKSLPWIVKIADKIPRRHKELY